MNNTVTPQRRQLIELALQGVLRPKYQEEKACVAEIVALESEKAENIKQSAALPASDPKRVTRRRDIVSRLEELYERQSALQPEIAEETARLLDEQLERCKARDREAQAKTKEALAVYQEAERAEYAAAKVLDAQKKNEEQIHAQGFYRCGDAIRAHADAFPQLYQGNPPTRIPTEVLA